jgi:DNA-binding transcriptional regulator YiaG
MLRVLGLTIRVGVSESMVRQWESGSRRPSGSAQILLRRLADGLAKQPA